MRILQHFIFDVFRDPWNKVRHTRVNARILALAATDAPRHDADLGPSAAVGHH